MKVFDVIQRSPEWHQARLGRLCGSRAADMMATIQKGEAAARRDLRMQLVCERLTNASQESGYVNADMQRGIDLEPLALAAYEADTGSLVRSVGFVAHDELPAGCSPDGLVEEDGLLEIKCPKSSTHLGYLKSKRVPTDYMHQITHNLWITGASWADFVSFDDRFPTSLQFLRLRVKRESVDIAAYELAARLFLSEVEKEYHTVQSLAMVPF